MRAKIDTKTTINVTPRHGLALVDEPVAVGVHHGEGRVLH